jgi:hypothetical protein
MSMKIKCSDCLVSLLKSSEEAATISCDDSLLSVKNRGGLTLASDWVFQICQASEKVVRLMLTISGLHSTFHKQAVNGILTEVLQSNLQRNAYCLIHSTALLQMVISRYCLIRIRYEAKKADNQSNMRQKLNRLVIFSHI